MLPFANESFDVVFSSNVIEHIPYDLYRSYLGEIYGILKPGGRFALGAPNYPIKRPYDLKKAWSYRGEKYTYYYLFGDPTHCKKLSIFSVEKHLKEAMFGEINLRPTYLFFETNPPFMRREKIRYLFRVFGDKFFGHCVRPVVRE